MKGLVTIAALLAAWLPGGALAAAEAATTERQYGGIFLERFQYGHNSEVAQCTDVYLNPAYIIEVRPSPWPVTDATKHGTWGTNCERSASVEGIVVQIILSHGGSDLARASYLYNGSLSELRLELWDAHP